MVRASSTTAENHKLASVLLATVNNATHHSHTLPTVAIARQRVDVMLVDRGIFESRAKAAAAIIAGEVQLAKGGRRINKPGQTVPEGTEFRVAERNRFVSRGGIKLENALDAFPALSLEGRNSLDAGASTGGFTDCLLQNGVRHVIAVDVAYGEFHSTLRADPRVTVIERKNIRELTADELEYRPDLIVADLSFIALAKVIDNLVACAADEFDMVVLVKPQFEVGKERVGKGGVVRDRDTRIDATHEAAVAAVAAGCTVRGTCSSGLPGPAGNKEAFLWLQRSDGSVQPDAELRALAESVEPT